MEKLSSEMRRWLEDTIPVGRSIDSFICRSDDELKILQKFIDTSTSINGVCSDALANLANSYEALDENLASKLNFIFGPSILDSELSSKELPELEWLLSVCLACSAESTERLQQNLKQLDADISEKQQILNQMNCDKDHLREVEAECIAKQNELSRFLRKNEITNENQKSNMAQKLVTFNDLSSKKKQYKKSTTKFEKELTKRAIDHSFSAAILVEQQKRIENQKKRAEALEGALRYYCGLSSDKQEAESQLDMAADELNKINMKLIEKLRDN